MYGKYFSYDGELSSSYNLIIGGLEQNDLVFGLEREPLRGDFNRYRNKLGHMGAKWSNPLVFTISFIKDVCTESSQQNLVFTEEEVNAINAWLTSPDYPTLFHMYDYDFERDSLDNMILIDSPVNTAEFVIEAEGYNPTTFQLNGSACTITTEDLGLLDPPTPRVEWLDGYFSVQFYREEYPANVMSISCDGVAYESISTNDWLAMDPVDRTKYEHCYTKLIHKTKVLNVKYDYFGIFTDITPQIIGGDVVGFTAQFTTNSPFAWTNEIIQHADITSDANLNFFSYSAEKYRDLYPVIEVHVDDDGGEDDREIVLIECIDDDINLQLRLMKGATTMIDCGRCMATYILDDDPKHREINEAINNLFYDNTRLDTSYVRDGSFCVVFGEADESAELIEPTSFDSIDWSNVVVTAAEMEDDGTVLSLTVYEDIDSTAETDIYPEVGLSDTRYMYWPRLRYGNNEFHITGKCSFSMKYREPRKVGDW